MVDALEEVELNSNNSKIQQLGFNPNPDPNPNPNLKADPKPR
jgi:hypothetical protein